MIFEDKGQLPVVPGLPLVLVETGGVLSLHPPLYHPASNLKTIFFSSLMRSHCKKSDDYMLQEVGSIVLAGLNMYMTFH
jgi:hypothetical protein